MEVIKYIIIDDEPIAHRIIEGYCLNFSFLKKEGNFYNGFEALEFLRKNTVDLIFLDMNMPKLTGFEMVKSIINPPKVIVTSAHQEFALQGYDLAIIDYLLKPFSQERFLKAINKLSSKKAPIPQIPSPHEPSSIFLKTDKKYIQIELEKLNYVEALGNYSKVFHQGGMIICPEKISDLEAKLGKDFFLRVHKSYLINTKKIISIEGNRIRIGDREIPVGQTYKIIVADLFN
jgi:DNA-binding LytR/AlgR family response regulator